MKFYLYTWNPNRWNWTYLQLAVDDLAEGRRYEDRWSCGTTRKIEEGDFFFLMRVGEDPKGIIGGGYITSASYEGDHWDPEKALEGIPALRTNVEFTSLSLDPIVALETLKQRHPQYDWTPRNSGRQIPDQIASDLIELIRGDQSVSFHDPIREDKPQFVEGSIRNATIKTYDRCQRARQACIDHYGYKCAACYFDFEQAYGGIGKNYIQVHHVTQLADIGEEYEIDPIKDLRPVCANCHVMLHRIRPAMSVDRLSMLMGSRRRSGATCGDT